MRSSMSAVFAAFVLAGASASAAPFPASSGAKDDTAYTFTAKQTGGKGVREWTVKLPDEGVYLATFAVNFGARGSISSPVAFSCLLIAGGSENVVQSTALSEGNLSWNMGLSGSGIVKVNKSDQTVQVICGTGDNSKWAFGDRPLQVTFLKLAGQVVESLTVAKVVYRATPGTAH